MVDFVVFYRGLGLFEVFRKSFFDGWEFKFKCYFEVSVIIL